MLRLCESEGRFDFGAYRALHEDVSWEEAIRINTAMVVIGDERSDFATWYAKHGRKIADAEAAATDDTSDRDAGAPTLETLLAERSAASNGIAFAEDKIHTHRQALLQGATEGLLSSEQLTMAERLRDQFKDQLGRIEAAIHELAQGETDTQQPTPRARGAT